MENILCRDGLYQCKRSNGIIVTVLRDGVEYVVETSTANGTVWSTETYIGQNEFLRHFQYRFGVRVGQLEKIA